MTPLHDRHGRRSSLSRPVRALAVGAMLTLAGCGSSLLGTTSSTVASPSTASSGASSTTVPLNGEVAVAFPVVSCVDPGNSSSPITSRTGWKPTILVAPVPTSLAGKVAFYTDGLHTVLGPTGWTCALVTPGTGGPSSASTTTTSTDQTGSTVPASGPTSGQNGAIATDGGTTLVVYPDNDPNPPTSGPPAPGTEGIFATWASTGSNAGVDLVCPFFTIPSWQSQQAGCSTTRPTGETSNALTPDVAQVTDPAGIVGSLSASGGQGAVTGVVLFPQVTSAVDYGSSVAVAAESCALADAALCPTVLSDFEVREFPTPGRG
jgi:hypothetical protein